MSSFAPASKRRKVKEFKVGEEFFPGECFDDLASTACLRLESSADVGKIQYRPDAPADEVLCFRHYNAQQVREMLHAHVNREMIRFYLLAGCEGSDNGGMAPVLCLLLAHIQRHW